MKVAEIPAGVRMLAVPTTLSAAEFTPFAGVTDVAKHAKEGFGHPLLAPRAVILDPAMTLADLGKAGPGIEAAVKKYA